MDELFEQIEQLEQVYNLKDDASRLKVLYNVIGSWVRKPADTLDSIHQTADNIKDVTAHGRLLVGNKTLSAGNLTSFIDHLNGTLGQTRLLFQFTFLGISGGAGLAAATDGCFSMIQGNYVSGATYLAGSCCHFGSCLLGLPATFKGYFLPPQSMFLTTVGGVAQWYVPYCRRGLRQLGSKLTKSADLMNSGVSASAGITQIRKCLTPISQIINPQESEET